MRLFLLDVFKRSYEANINNEAIVIAYYTLMALFPLMIFVGNLLPLLHLEPDVIMPYIKMALPHSVYVTLKPYVVEYLTKGSSGQAASISGVLSVWAASRGFNSMKRVLNMAYRVADSQDILSRRLLAFIFTGFFGLCFVLFFIIYGFGQEALAYVTPLLNLPQSWLETFEQVKWPTTVIGMFLIMLMIYWFIPNAKVHMRCLFPGAICATGSWMLLTQVFSFCVKLFARSFLGYGAIGTVIVVMLWLSLTCWFIIFGGVINAAFEQMIYRQIVPKFNPITTYSQRLFEKINQKTKS